VGVVDDKDGYQNEKDKMEIVYAVFGLGIDMSVRGLQEMLQL
jgi:hypothetical protein